MKQGYLGLSSQERPPREVLRKLSLEVQISRFGPAEDSKREKQTQRL